MRNSITFKVTGDYALFTDPITKIGGEKASLMIPPYQALKGICESIYWKPSIIWYVDKLKIINKLQTESKGIRTIKFKEGGNDLSRYMYLKDVVYIIQAHFEFNFNRPEIANNKEEFNENKHYFIAKRSLEKGGRRDVFLGTRECQAYVEPVKFDDEKSYYESLEEMKFGIQYHSISYPDENGEGKLYTRFWDLNMEKGIINFCRPEDCLKTIEIKEMEQKVFEEGKFSGITEKGILSGYIEEEVENELDVNFDRDL